MVTISRLIILLNILTPSLAQPQHPPQSAHDSPLPAHRIAIIGAGAAGCSAAYHLSHFTPAPLSLTVFERAPRVGGRVINVPAFNNFSEPVELAGAIFVSANQILINATRDFGLSTQKRGGGGASDSKYDLGVWDGQGFVFKTEAQTEYSDDVGSSALASKWSGVAGMGRLLWRYGLSPLRLAWAKRSAMGKYARLYEEVFPFEELGDATREVGLIGIADSSGEELMRSVGVSERFMREVVQASTRVNYGNNLGSIHGLATMVSMATDGAQSVRGGNWQIFDRMVAESGAELMLNTSVTGIELLGTGEKVVHYKTFSPSDTDSGTSPVSTSTFDTVIFTIPYHQSSITFTPPLHPEPEGIDYVTQHVTLFASPNRPSPTFFNLTNHADVPDSILTTTPAGYNLSTRGTEALGPNNKFWSLSTLRKMSVRNATTGVDEQMFLYKTFSPEALEPAFLAQLFGLPAPTEGTVVEDLFPWMHKQTFLAYPYHVPRSEFGSFKLFFGTEGAEGGIQKVSGEDAMAWYTSPFETFFSTMETSALSGRNVAKLIVKGLENGGGGKVDGLGASDGHEIKEEL
jgi:prenylcysteine oxidase / farnesylcysteine lyase